MALSEADGPEDANFSGTLKFLVLHIFWIGFWLLWNQPWFPGFDFDPSPYGLLATVLGLEAIFLSILVLVSQNRQESKDRIAEEIHHQINTKAEVEIGLILRRLDDLERSIHHSNDEHLQLLRLAMARDTNGNGRRSVSDICVFSRKYKICRCILQRNPRV